MAQVSISRDLNVIRNTEIESDIMQFYSLLLFFYVCVLILLLLLLKLLCEYLTKTSLECVCFFLVLFSYF